MEASQGRMAKAVAGSADAADARMIARSAHLELVVATPEEAGAEAERIVTGAGGLIEHSTARDDAVQIQARVPAARLDEVLEALAALGREEHRSISAADVTEQHADLSTRLANARVLRDRLQQLVARAKDVKDVLAIEKELSRLQGQIERLQAQLDRLDSRVELSSLSLTLERAPVLGPLGHVGYGLWWALSKLFVIR